MWGEWPGIPYVVLLEVMGAHLSIPTHHSLSPNNSRSKKGILVSVKRKNSGLKIEVVAPDGGKGMR